MLDKDEIEKLEKFYRYLDKDGDGIAYRTLPGVHPKARLLHARLRATRSTAPTPRTRPSTRSCSIGCCASGRRRRSSCRARSSMRPRGSDIGIVSIGSCDGAIREAMDMLKAHGVGVDYMRVRAFPFGEEVERFLAAHQLLFVVEQNRDAQFRSLLTLETAVEKSKLRSLLHYNGLPISSSFIVEGVLAAGAAARRKRSLKAPRSAEESP